MSICLSRLRDTRIEEDSDNSTSYKYLLVRNVLRITFFFSSYYVARLLENILRQAKRAELITARCSIFSSSLDSSKTFRTRRSLEECKFFESILSLGLRNAIWGTKYEMLFERSEFIEWFEEFVFRPPSSGRFRTFLFDSSSFGDERKRITKKHKNIGNNTAMCRKSAIFAFKFWKLA